MVGRKQKPWSSPFMIECIDGIPCIDRVPVREIGRRISLKSMTMEIRITTPKKRGPYRKTLTRLEQRQELLREKQRRIERQERRRLREKHIAEKSVRDEKTKALEKIKGTGDKKEQNRRMKQMTMQRLRAERRGLQTNQFPERIRKRKGS